MDKAVLNKKSKFTLENTNFLKFINAIKNDDPSIINKKCSIENLDDLFIDYLFELNKNNKKTAFDKQIQVLNDELYKLHSIALLLDCTNDIKTFLKICYDNDLLQLSWGVDKIDEKDYDLYVSKIINNIDKKTNILNNKIKMLKKNIIEVKNNDDDNNIYNTIGVLSMNLGFDLDYSKLTIIKFITYVNLINKKDE